MKKRFISIALLAAMLLASCSADSTGETTDTAAETTANLETEATPEETEYAPDLPDVTFSGEDFRVLYRIGTHAYNGTDIFAAELNGEVINDAVYNRNIDLEEQYDFKFMPISNDQGTAPIKEDYMAASNEYDLVYEQMNQTFPLALEEYFYDWYNLSHFHPSDPWWDENCARELSFANKLYVMGGDISMRPSTDARFVYYNKGLLDQFGMEEPYDLVREGKWTIDKMTEMVATVSLDRDGNGEFNAEDTLGMLTESPNFFLSGCGILYTVKDENDIPVVGCNNERTLSALEAVKTMLTVPNATISYTDAGKDKDTSGFAHMYEYLRMEYFATDHFLFVQNGSAEAYCFIDMDPGYGVLPNPKLDEEQETYYHLIDNHSCAWFIPVGVQNTDMLDVLLTAWAYNSTEVVDAYYETTLKYKRFNAPDDAEMLDIIRSTTRYEISMLCNLGISDVITDAYKSGNFASSYTKKETQIATQIEKNFGKFME